MEKNSKLIYIIIGAVALVAIAVLLIPGNSSNNEGQISDNGAENVVNTGSQNVDNNDNSEAANAINDLKLYSDDSQIVFNMRDIYYIIFHHDGNNLTGLEYVYNYDDENIARLAMASIKATHEGEDVEKVELKGSSLRVIFNEKAYENETLESVKESYAFLDEVINK